MTKRPAVTRDIVEARLAEVAAAFDAANRGTHSYSRIWQAGDNPSCNWTANYVATGSRLSLSEMRAGLERVQAELPFVDFGEE